LGAALSGECEVLGVDIGDSETADAGLRGHGSFVGLVGALLVEFDDEMIACERRYIATVSVAETDGINNDLRSLSAATSDGQQARESRESGCCRSGGGDPRWAARDGRTIGCRRHDAAHGGRAAV